MPSYTVPDPYNRDYFATAVVRQCGKFAHTYTNVLRQRTSQPRNKLTIDHVDSTTGITGNIRALTYPTIPANLLHELQEWATQLWLELQ
jgi:hypothetical protein